jgi:hypothetical protein
LSLLLGIPHAILDNSHGKLGRFMAGLDRGSVRLVPGRLTR